MQIDDVVILKEKPIVADYDKDTHTVGLLIADADALAFPAAAFPFLMERRKIYLHPEFDERVDDEGNLFHHERVVKVNDRDRHVRYEVELPKTFQFNGFYNLLPINNDEAPVITMVQPAVYTKPEGWENWIQQEIDAEAFRSKILRIYTKNSGSVIYHEELSHEYYRVAIAALATLRGHWLWWCPIRLLNKTR